MYPALGPKGVLSLGVIVGGGKSQPITGKPAVKVARHGYSPIELGWSEGVTWASVPHLRVPKNTLWPPYFRFAETPLCSNMAPFVVVVSRRHCVLEVFESGTVGILTVPLPFTGRVIGHMAAKHCSGMMQNVVIHVVH